VKKFFVILIALCFATPSMLQSQPTGGGQNLVFMTEGFVTQYHYFQIKGKIISNADVGYEFDDVRLDSEEPNYCESNMIHVFLSTETNCSIYSHHLNSACVASIFSNYGFKRALKISRSNGMLPEGTVVREDIEDAIIYSGNKNNPKVNIMGLMTGILMITYDVISGEMTITGSDFSVRRLTPKEYLIRHPLFKTNPKES